MPTVRENHQFVAVLAGLLIREKITAGAFLQDNQAAIVGGRLANPLRLMLETSAPAVGQMANDDHLNRLAQQFNVNLHFHVSQQVAQAADMFSDYDGHTTTDSTLDVNIFTNVRDISGVQVSDHYQSYVNDQRQPTSALGRNLCGFNAFAQQLWCIVQSEPELQAQLRDEVARQQAPVSQTIAAVPAYTPPVVSAEALDLGDASSIALSDDDYDDDFDDHDFDTGAMDVESGSYFSERNVTPIRQVQELVDNTTYVRVTRFLATARGEEKEKQVQFDELYARHLDAYSKMPEYRSDEAALDNAAFSAAFEQAQRFGLFAPPTDSASSCAADARAESGFAADAYDAATPLGSAY